MRGELNHLTTLQSHYKTIYTFCAAALRSSSGRCAEMAPPFLPASDWAACKGSNIFPNFKDLPAHLYAGMACIHD